MEQFFDWVEHSFIPWAGHFSNNKYVTAIRDTFYRTIPLWIVLAFFRVVQWMFLNPEGPVMGENGMGIGALLTGGLYGEEYQATGFYQLGRTFARALGLSDILLLFFLTMTLAIQLTKVWGGDKTLAAFCALGGLFIFTQMESGYAGDGTVPVGHPPLRALSALLFGALSAWMLAWMERFPRLRLRVPPGLPERLAQPLVRIVPAGLTLLAFLLFSMAVTQLFVSYYREIDGFVQSAVRPAAQTLPFALAYQCAVWLLWWCGLFGYGVTSIIADFAYWPAQLANQALAATSLFQNEGGFVQGFVFTTEFFHTPNGHVLALAVAVLAFSNNEHWRRVTGFLLLPLIFNMHAPILFCLPVVMNPVFLLPYLIAPLANTVVAWAAISWGVVPTFQFVTADTVPFILSGVLSTGSLMGGVLQVVVFILDIFIYAPFIIVANRMDKSREGKGDTP